MRVRRSEAFGRLFSPAIVPCRAFREKLRHQALENKMRRNRIGWHSPSPAGRGALLSCSDVCA